MKEDGRPKDLRKETVQQRKGFQVRESCAYRTGPEKDQHGCYTLGAPFKEAESFVEKPPGK